MPCSLPSPFISTVKPPLTITSTPKLRDKMMMTTPSCVSSTRFAVPPLLFSRNFSTNRPAWSLKRNRQPCIVSLRRNLSNTCRKTALRENLEAIGIPTSVPVRMALELLQAGHRYLDVRTPEEFSAGHAPGAINFPYMYRFGAGMMKNPDFLEEVVSHFGRDDEIIVGCQSGKRSIMASRELLAAGFSGITDIAGGFAAWAQNRLPTGS